MDRPLRELAGGRSSRPDRPSKGIHVFVARDRMPMETGILARTEKSVLFVIPWQGGWLIGDTDTPWRGRPGQAGRHRRRRRLPAGEDERAAGRAATRDDVHGVTVGLRPLVAEAARSDTTRISRKHVVETPAPGLTTIAGGKYTTYRVMAADLIDAVARWARGASVTRDVPLLDGRGRELAALIEARPELGEPLEGGGTCAPRSCTRARTRARSTSRTCSSAAPGWRSPRPTAGSPPPRPPPR